MGRSKISIITAVHNQLSMNRLFAQALRANTSQDYELIVVDNGSSDGSADFFESIGAKVIRNSENYSYPHSQNQGIALAEGDVLAFLNNDLIASPDWDEILLQSMAANQLDVVTACGIERLETRQATRKLRRRWNWIRGSVGLFGQGGCQLRLMHRLMYPDWQAFCSDRRHRHAKKILPGFVGNTVAVSRRGLDKIGLWDERIQAADFDLFLRTAVRARDVGDIRPMHIALDCFMHHYIRLTMRGGYPPFADRANLISLEQKWLPRDLALLQV